VGNSNLEASGSVRGQVKDEPVNTGIGVRDVKPLGLSNNTGKRNRQAAVITLSDDSDDQAAHTRIKVCLPLCMQSKGLSAHGAQVRKSAGGRKQKN